MLTVLYVEEVDLVSTWLAQYPFGGENTSNSNRQMIIANIIDGNHVYDDSDYAHSMVCVLTRMYDTKLFKHQLEEHGLINTLSHPGLRNFGGGNRGSSSSSQLHEPEPLMRASDDWDFPDVSPSPREVEQSPEEQALRRRRREAMVLGESGRPISREDIIERDPAEDIADEEVEEELEQLVEEVMEAEAANDSKRSANDRSWLDWLSRLRPTGLAPANEPW